MDKQIADVKTKAIALGKDGQKQRALIQLKHKKYLEKERDKTDGVILVLQQTAQNVESAQMDVNVYDAMKVGDACIKDLRAQVSLEDFEELMDEHKDNLAV